MTPEQTAWIESLMAEGQVGCRDWPWNSDLGGYGMVNLNGKTVRVGHVILERSGRPRQGKRFAACQIHSCDRPSCVAPWHLRWGTQSENLQDMTTKGRRVPCPGARNGRAHLSGAQVAEIRKSAGKVSQRELAAIYGVRQPQISRIISGKAWK